MKKIALYSTLVLAAATALTACNDDYKDWAEPVSPDDPGAVTVSFAPTSVSALDLRGVADQTVVAFSPNLTTNAQEASTYYDVMIYNTDRTDSVAVKADEQGKVSRAELQGAVVAFYGNQETAHEVLLDITAYTLVDGTMCVNRAADVRLTVTPQQQELPPVWYVLGNCIGRGTFVNHSTMGLYTSTVAMYVNPYNYDELVYASKMCENAQFKIILKAGDKEHFIGGEVYDDNIIIADEGYYKIIANTKEQTVRYERLDGDIAVYGGMSMSNGTALAKITTSAKGENHDWLGDLVVDTDAPQGEGIRFVADDGTTWGSGDFPAGRAALDGAGIPYKSGTYKVVFNDILKTFRFIER